MYAVLGVSGNTGRVVAERVARRGARVVVRDAAKGASWAHKAEVAVANLLDVDALTQAFRGVEGAYVLLPPNRVSTDYVAEQAKMTQVIAEAARRVSLQHIVLLSSVAAQYPEGTGLIRTRHYAEKVLREAVPNTTFVRPAYFLENWGASLRGVADGIFPTFYSPDVAIDQVATADIGRIAADALLAGPAGHEIIELASGHQAWSPREIAGIVSKLVGRELQVVYAPLSAIVPTFTSLGMSANVAGLYHEMIGTFNAATGDFWERTGNFVRTSTTPESVFAGLLAR